MSRLKSTGKADLSEDLAGSASVMPDWTREAVASPLDRGPWIATASGGMWSLQNPHPQDVKIRDIAAGLSRTCRYAGQIREEVEQYAVSEHSVLMLEWLEAQGDIEYAEDALKILLHDASEAFIVDMPSPLKALIPEFRVIEDRAQDAIDSAFGLEAARISKGVIKSIDVRIRMDEREALINEPALSHQKRVIWEHTPEMEGLGVTIRGLLPNQARLEFLAAFCRVCETYPYRSVVSEALISTQYAQARELLPAPEPELELG